MSQLLARRGSRGVAVLAARQQWSHRALAAAPWPPPTTGTFRQPDEENTLEQRRMSALPMIRRHGYHTSTVVERGAVAVMLGLGTVAAVSYSASQGIQAYNEWKDSLPEEPSQEETVHAEANNVEQEATQQQQQTASSQQQQKEDRSSKRENIFNKWFGLSVGAKYYEGGFEDSMTRREAALILGVRESSPTSRIKGAHRKLLYVLLLQIRHFRCDMCMTTSSWPNRTTICPRNQLAISPLLFCIYLHSTVF
jgi:hypothetical protein